MNGILYIWTRLSALAAGAVFLALLGFLVASSWPYWSQFGSAGLTAADWYPYEGRFGLLAVITGTAWAVVIALCIAVPTGIAAALVMAEISGRRLCNFLRMTMELLAGIPSIVYGLIGLWLLLPIVKQEFGLLTGHSLLAAGLLLSLMILPTIVVMSVDALVEAGRPQREAALSLGMTWGERIRVVILPRAWQGIRSGILLGVGRALGETMAVMLVVGSIDRLPAPWYNVLQPAQTITSRLGREVGESVIGSTHWAALMASALVLVCFSIVIARATRGRSIMDHD